MSTEDIRVAFGLRLRALRLERGWTQVEMADFLAMNRSYLSEIETGKKDPSLTILSQYGNLLGTAQFTRAEPTKSVVCDGRAGKSAATWSARSFVPLDELV